MKVNISGRHVTVNDELESYAREKAEKIGKFFSGIQHIDWVLGHESDQNTVEASVVLGQGAKLLGKAEAEDMKAAIDMAESKLTKQIRRFHAKLKSHRDRRRVADGAPIAVEETEATYEQVVQEMLEEDEG
ncbi:MAG: ribosome hibernation-promoting factor, HPF/YfiA family [Planctomycetota bacterium]|jgi:putative sigma-54 modulation protein